MPEVLDNPVVKDTEFDALREAASKADSGQEFDVPSVTIEEPHAPSEPDKTPATVDKGTTSKPETSPEKPTTEPEKADERPRDEHGRFLPKDETKVTQLSDKSEQLKIVEAPPTKTETPYEQAKREGREREAKAWQKIEAEKAEIAKQRDELRRSMEQRQTPLRDANNVTAEEYEEAMWEFAQSGDLETAKKARDAAKAIRAAEQQVQVQSKQEAFRAQFVKDAQEIINQDPEATKEGSPLCQAMAETFAQADQLTGIDKVLWNTPGGYKMAYEHAKAKMQAGLVSGLEEDNKKLKAEIARLNGLTAIGGAGPTSPSTPKKLEDMDIDEGLTQLRRQAERADGIAA